MATPVLMPRQGQSVESCIIAKWHKAKGDKVEIGDVLFTYETDKATFDEEAKTAGTMLAVFFTEGDDVPCLTNVCVIGNEGESTDEFKPNGTSDAENDVSEATPAGKDDISSQQDAPNVGAIHESPETLQPKASGGQSPISPRAKNLAQKQGADLRYAVGTGPNGRVIERDVRELMDKGILITSAAKDSYQGFADGTGMGGRVTIADAATAPIEVDNRPETEEVKHTNIRKVIAKAMNHSLSTMAQLTLNASFDATEILSIREKFKNAKGSGLESVTINDIILFAVAKTLQSHKDCNAHYYDDKMVYFKNVNLGIAVDTPRGLMVPTVFNANLKHITAISKEVKALADQCQQGTISPDSLKGGTFTVTNLGTFGIESFTPVINPPQTCILGVNTIETKVKEVNGQPVCYKSMSLSLTFDHRALDGAPAARFLKDLKGNLENFTLMLVK